MTDDDKPKTVQTSEGTANLSCVEQGPVEAKENCEKDVNENIHKEAELARAVEEEQRPEVVDVAGEMMWTPQNPYVRPAPKKQLAMKIPLLRPRVKAATEINPPKARPLQKKQLNICGTSWSAQCALSETFEPC